MFNIHLHFLIYVYLSIFNTSPPPNLFSAPLPPPSPPHLSSRPQKLRWPSFQNSHRPGPATAQLQVGSQSVLQMNLLQKLSLLQLTALLEKHTPTNKHGFSW